MTTTRELKKHLQAKQFDLVEESCLNRLALETRLSNPRKAEWIELLAQVYARTHRQRVANRLLGVAAELRRQHLSKQVPLDSASWLCESGIGLPDLRVKQPVPLKRATPSWTGAVTHFVDRLAVLRHRVGRALVRLSIF